MSAGPEIALLVADAIVAEGLVKTYGAVRALDGLDLRVPAGTVLAVLGPNGAGKTTAVKILTTLVAPDSGSANVAGIDVMSAPADVRELIGVSGQYAAVDEYLTGYENLDMVGRLYHLGARRAPERAREHLEQFDLADAADRMARTYPGGNAPPRRPGRRADREPTGAVPRRAHDGARSPQPHRQLAGDPRPGRRRHLAAADDAVPRGGRPAG